MQASYFTVQWIKDNCFACLFHLITSYDEALESFIGTIIHMIVRWIRGFYKYRSKFNAVYIVLDEIWQSLLNGKITI